MIIDFHVHAFPKDIRERRDSYFLGEPNFELLYSSNQRLVGKNDIIKMMDIQKISISVIFGFPWRCYDNFRRNNDYIIEIVQEYPDRFKGFCCVDPFHPKALYEVERCLRSGLSGVGELAFYERGIDKECLSVLSPIMSICRKEDIPILIHTNEEIGHLYPGKTPNTIGQTYDFIKNFQENKIILSHWGGGLFFFSLLKKQVNSILRNTYYDIAASPFLYNNKIYGIAKELIGVDKFIFGTDYPLISPSRYLYEMLGSGLRDEDMQKICFNNSAKLLRIKPF